MLQRRFYSEQQNGLSRSLFLSTSSSLLRCQHVITWSWSSCCHLTANRKEKAQSAGEVALTSPPLVPSHNQAAPHRRAGRTQSNRRACHAGNSVCALVLPGAGQSGLCSHKQPPCQGDHQPAGPPEIPRISVMWEVVSALFNHFLASKTAACCPKVPKHRATGCGCRSDCWFRPPYLWDLGLVT